MNFSVDLTGGPDIGYPTTVDFGDGIEERDTTYRGSGRTYSHRYERNGTYVMQVTVRNPDTNDRLTCSRSVVFDSCERSIFPEYHDAS